MKELDLPVASRKVGTGEIHVHIFTYLYIFSSFDSFAFFLMTDAPNGLKHFTRAPLRTAMEGEFNTGNMRFKARERYSYGWSDPRGIYGSPGA